MTCLQKNHARTNEVDRYATCADLQSIFADNLDHLYLLAYLLNADHEKAEQCFVAGLSDSVATNQVFLDWARSWARRAVIQNAIHLARLHPGNPSLHLANTVPADDSNQPYLEDFEISAVLRLDEFERFVFVMTVLERYSDQDTSALLGCTAQQVREGRVRALEQIGAALSGNYGTEKVTSVHRNPKKTQEEINEL